MSNFNSLAFLETVNDLNEEINEKLNNMDYGDISQILPSGVSSTTFKPPVGGLKLPMLGKDFDPKAALQGLRKVNKTPGDKAPSTQANETVNQPDELSIKFSKKSESKNIQENISSSIAKKEPENFLNKVKLRPTSQIVNFESDFYNKKQQEDKSSLFTDAKSEAKTSVNESIEIKSDKISTDAKIRDKKHVVPPRKNKSIFIQSSDVVLPSQMDNSIKSRGDSLTVDKLSASKSQNYKMANVERYENKNSSTMNEANVKKLNPINRSDSYSTSNSQLELRKRPSKSKQEGNTKRLSVLDRIKMFDDKSIDDTGSHHSEPKNNYSKSYVPPESSLVDLPSKHSSAAEIDTKLVGFGKNAYEDDKKESTADIEENSKTECEESAILHLVEEEKTGQEISSKTEETKPESEKMDELQMAETRKIDISPPQVKNNEIEIEQIKDKEKVEELQEKKSESIHSSNNLKPELDTSENTDEESDKMYKPPPRRQNKSPLPECLAIDKSFDKDKIADNTDELKTGSNIENKSQGEFKKPPLKEECWEKDKFDTKISNTDLNLKATSSISSLDELLEKNRKLQERLKKLRGK